MTVRTENSITRQFSRLMKAKNRGRGSDSKQGRHGTGPKQSFGSRSDAGQSGRNIDGRRIIQQQFAECDRWSAARE
jgi:hypothetical protein